MILNPLEIEKRCKNLELHGLPEADQENCELMVKEVLTKVTPENVTIKDCFRIGRKYKPNGEKNTRPILIQFETKNHRDITYSGRRNLKKIEGPPLYLNENLPQNLRTLRGKANALKKQKGYKFIWVKNGNVLLRQNEDSNVIVIKKISDLDKIK